jgi:ubiquinone/menaquinone biosynthesis C-methylase UbiE
MSDFDAKASTWDTDPAKVERARRVAEAIAREAPLRKWMSVLEYGCGTGLLGLALHHLVEHVTLADSSREMLAVLWKKIQALGVHNATPIELDLSQGPQLDARFDVVCTLMTLHHIDDTDAILRRFHELLASGGILCISDLDKEDGSFHGPGFRGHCGFDRGDLASRLAQAGFRNARFTAVGDVAKPAGGAVRRYPIFLTVCERV